MSGFTGRPVPRVGEGTKPVSWLMNIFSGSILFKKSKETRVFSIGNVSDTPRLLADDLHGFSSRPGGFIEKVIPDLPQRVSEFFKECTVTGYIVHLRFN